MDLSAERVTSSGEVVHRQHDRYPVLLGVTFTADGVTGTGLVRDLSSHGCRVAAECRINKGEFLGMLVELPGLQCSLSVSLAVVRWATMDEFGAEFIKMAPDDQMLLRVLITKLGSR